VQDALPDEISVFPSRGFAVESAVNLGADFRGGIMRTLVPVLAVFLMSCDKPPSNRYEYAAQQNEKYEQQRKERAAKLEGRTVYGYNGEYSKDPSYYHFRKDCPEFIEQSKPTVTLLPSYLQKKGEPAKTKTFTPKLFELTVRDGRFADAPGSYYTPIACPKCTD